MNFGFNSKLQMGSDVYDVQTEDRGASHLIDTLVLNRGKVVYRHSTSYEDLAGTSSATAGTSQMPEQLIDQAILRARVEKQHREILEALRDGVLSVEKAPAPKDDGGIAVKLLNSASWLEAGRVSLNIEVWSNSAGQPVTGARVEAFIESGRGTPETYFARTGADGRTFLQFPFPTLAERSVAALVIRAHVAEGLSELRYNLRPRRTNQ
jgi:hypothetical protein